MRGALELLHSVNLRHPNIVQTYQSTQRPMEVSDILQKELCPGHASVLTIALSLALKIRGCYI